MNPIIQLHNISDINNFVKSKTNHPLVAVVDFSKADEYIDCLLYTSDAADE